MHKYFIVYCYTAGRAEYATAVFGNKFVTLDHEVTEKDITRIQSELNKNQFDYRTITNIIKIASD